MNKILISTRTPPTYTKYIRRKLSEGFRVKYALEQNERRSLIKEVGIHALVVFEYYLRLASIDKKPITDEDTAKYFDWSPHTAKRHRLSLMKAGWVAIDKMPLRGGGRMEMYHLGKTEVRDRDLGPEAETKKVKKEPKPDGSMLDLS